MEFSNPLKCLTALLVKNANKGGKFRTEAAWKEIKYLPWG